MLGRQYQSFRIEMERNFLKRYACMRLSIHIFSFMGTHYEIASVLSKNLTCKGFPAKVLYLTVDFNLYSAERIKYLYI